MPNSAPKPPPPPPEPEPEKPNIPLLVGGGVGTVAAGAAAIKGRDLLWTYKWVILVGIIILIMIIIAITVAIVNRGKNSDEE